MSNPGETFPPEVSELMVLIAGQYRDPMSPDVTGAAWRIYNAGWRKEDTSHPFHYGKERKNT